MKVVIEAYWFWGVLLYISQVLNNQNALIVQSILQNMVKKIRIHFHHHHQARLIHYFGWEQTPLLMWVRPGYFINWVRCAWPGQNVTRLTQITRMAWPGFNPRLDNLVSFHMHTHIYIYISMLQTKAISLKNQTHT